MIFDAMIIHSLLNLCFQVSKLGFGCMGLTGVYNTPLPEEEGIAIIKEAFRKGVTFFDTSDVYGVDHANEYLVGKVNTDNWFCKNHDHQKMHFS